MDFSEDTDLTKKIIVTRVTEPPFKDSGIFRIDIDICEEYWYLTESQLAKLITIFNTALQGETENT